MLSPYGNANWILYVGRHEQQLPRKSYFEINSISGMFQCALRGHGIATLPSFPSFLSSGLKIVLPQLECPEIQLYYIFHKQRANFKRMDTLYQYLMREKERSSIF